METSVLDSRRKTIFLDLSAFGVGLAAAFVLGWSTRDLLWGLWISSFVSGGVFYLRGSVKNPATLNSVELVLGSISVLFGFAIFMLHFGMFHYIQGSILDLLIPLEPHPERVYVGNLTWKGGIAFSFGHTVAIAVSRYWVLVTATVVHQFLSPTPNLKSQNDSFRPYYFVLKLHLLMFPLAALYAFGLESFLVYILIFFVFFTPSSLKILFGIERKGETVDGRRQTEDVKSTPSNR